MDLTPVNLGTLLSWSSSSHGGALCSGGVCGRLAVPSHRRREGVNLPWKAALPCGFVLGFFLGLGFFYDGSPEVLRALWMLSRHLNWQCFLFAEKGI